MPKRLPQARRRAHCSLRPQVASGDHKSSTSTATSPPPLHSFLGLPAEIKQIIFSSLSDVASLAALILTCSSLYYFFLDSESSILAKILVKQITPGLMRNAFAVWDSTKKVPGGIHTVDYSSLLFNGDEMPSSALPKWGLRDALVLSKTHEHVQFWANKFASSALSHHLVMGKPEMNPTPISASELSRIERSLYRFQFYCNLYALRNRGCSNHLEIIFMSFFGFAPWENEQLICIREYLRDAVSDSLKDVVEHGTKRAARKSRFGNHWSKVDPSDCLPLGLNFVHRLVLAKTHRERRGLLLNRPMGCEGFFDTPIRNDFDNLARLLHLTDEEQRELIPEPVVRDDDTGPEDAWRWANSHRTSRYWYNNPELDDLRATGYVMWDSSRLLDWGILDKNWRFLWGPRREARWVSMMIRSVRRPVIPTRLIDFGQTGEECAARVMRL